jgi:prepilin-type N-terminal cleavage/methylation domain-containing protein
VAKYTPPSQHSFTLIELLVVVGILVLLLAITLIALNPAEIFIRANNAKRQSDVNSILNAVTQHTLDVRGAPPPMLTMGAFQNISSEGVPNLCATLVPRYIAVLPNDPVISSGGFSGDCASYDTGYRLRREMDGRYTVDAPYAELSVTISVSR